MSESKLQQAAVKLFAYKYPKLPPQIFFKISNEGYRSNGTGMRYKAEGLRAGVADMMLAVARHNYNGVFIEFKFGGNKQTESQQIFEDAVVQQGYLYVVINSLDEFERFIYWYLPC